MVSEPAEHVVVCPILVGRGAFTVSLDRALARLGTGEGQIVAISGEAGLGKSRMVAEAKRRATSPDSGRSAPEILEGHCFEPDASLPYAPLIDLLRGCIASHDQGAVVECLGGDAPELAKILPELASWIPGLIVAPHLEPEQEKRRIFQGLSQFFVRAAARQPLLVVIEDLHWADDTSLEFLASLARRIRTLPVLVLLTYRSDEVHPALEQFLAGVDRERIGVEWPLARLSLQEVSEMLTAIFGLAAPARPEFIDPLYELTEGNPFFLEEILKSLVASGDIFFKGGAWDRKPVDELSIPRSVHAAVAARTDRLSDAARRVLTLASVAGRRFDFHLLQLLADQDEPTLLHTIKELIDAQLVVEESADRFAFRHALTQQAIYTRLLARERRSLHRTIATTMRNAYRDAIDLHLPEIAHHAYASESWDEAYYYCQRVGESAQALNASRAAVEQFNRAITSAEHLRIEPPAALMRARGQALETLGEFDGARQDYERALGTAREAGDGVAEWQSLIDLGFLWAGRDYDRSGAYFRSASELADTLADPLLQARSLNRLGNWLVNMGRPREGLVHHASALEIFEAQADEQGTAETLDLIGMANGIYGDLPASFEAYGKAIELLRPLGPTLALSSALASRATWAGAALAEPVYGALGTLEVVERDATESGRVAETMGSPVAAAYMRWTVGSTYGGFGQLGRAVDMAADGLRIATEIGHEQWVAGAHSTLGQIYALMLCPEEALSHLELALAAAHNVRSAWWIGNITTYLALAHRLKGDAAAAEAVLAAVAGRDAEPQNLQERRMHWVWGLLALDGHDPNTALATADRLLATAPGGPREQYIPSLWHLRGDALLALKRYDEAATALEHARTGAEQRYATPYLWQIHASVGRLFQAQRRPDDAELAFAESRAIIASLAATIHEPRMRDEFERRASALLPPLRTPTANRVAKAAFGGLTAREREVAALVASGKSNRDIAEHLVLGERTIETHVGNVLSKLGFTSRAQIAAWAVESGLTRAP